MPEKVVVVAYNSLFLEYLSSLIRGGGFMVQRFKECDKALQHITALGADMIVVFECKEEDIWGFCSQLRQQCSAPILVTGRSPEHTTMIKAIDQGADFYLRLPFNPEEFIARSKALLRRQAYTRSGHI